MYYVDPFIFSITKLHMINKIQDDTGIYVIDKDGAYLKEINIFENLKDAKIRAFKLLDEFFTKKACEIMNIKEE